MTSMDARERILVAIHAIPRGEVASYGEVARRAGLPGRARMVAQLLSRNDDAHLPWHRVVRSDGRIAFPVDAPAHAEQCARLRAEGVDVREGRVRMHPRENGLDHAIWGVSGAACAPLARGAANARPRKAGQGDP